jgi:hypothetical protein
MFAGLVCFAEAEVTCVGPTIFEGLGSMTCLPVSVVVASLLVSRGPPASHQLAVFIDDIHLPEKETYGAVPALEMLRLLLDRGGIYQRCGEKVQVNLPPSIKIIRMSSQNAICA